MGMDCEHTEVREPFSFTSVGIKLGHYLLSNSVITGCHSLCQFYLVIMGSLVISGTYQYFFHSQCQTFAFGLAMACSRLLINCLSTAVHYKSVRFLNTACTSHFINICGGWDEEGALQRTDSKYSEYLSEWFTIEMTNSFNLLLRTIK